MQQSPELSLRYFNEAKKLRYDGRYAESIEMLKRSILVYLQDPDLPQNFYSMGKTYYLMGNYEYSVCAYKVYSNMCVVNNHPAILNDYLAYLRGDIHRGSVLLSTFENLARHIGHAVIDPMEKNARATDIAYYVEILKWGKDVPQSADYEAYHRRCIDTGMKMIMKWFDAFLEDFNREVDATSELAKTLLYT